MTAGRASRGTRYRPNRKRRASTAMLTAIAAAVSLTVFATLGARTVMSRISCTHQPLLVHVAVSGEIAPAVQQLGQYFNRQQRTIDGHCAQTRVQHAAPAAVAASFAQGKRGPAGAAVDAWIPDSQLWVNIARATAAGARRVPATGPVLAQSALVIVMPRPVAGRTPAFGATVSWRFLFPQSAGGPSNGLGLNVQLPDPATSAVGLVSLAEVHQLLGSSRHGRFDFARLAFNVQVVAPPGGGVSLPSLAKLSESARAQSTFTPVTVTSEQAVAQFDASHPQQPLAVRYPADGTGELTYPYVTTATSPLTRRAAQAFGTVLRSAYAQALVRAEGFRSANGLSTAWPAAYGLAAKQPRRLAQPGPANAAAAAMAWQKLSVGQRVLALTDVSAAMGITVAPGGPTLEQLLGHAAALGLAHFPDSAQMGLWAFASHLQGSQPYRQLVSIGPLPGPFGLVTRRQEIQHLAASVPVQHTGAALYSTILAAYRYMVASYQPHHVNAVVILTAGVEHARGDIAPATLIRDLTRLYNRNQPVSVTVIMIGTAGNYQVLQRIALATGGKAYDIVNPAQIRTIFYRAMGRNICRPHCPPA